jgi:hypothetical protein
MAHVRVNHRDHPVRRDAVTDPGAATIDRGLLDVLVDDPLHHRGPSHYPQLRRRRKDQARSVRASLQRHAATWCEFEVAAKAPPEIG